MKIVFPILTFFFVSSVLHAQDKGLVFKETEYFFGVMRQDTKSSHEFVFYNAGKDTVFLGHPKAGCGCTAVLLSDYSIAPGDTGHLGVTFNAVRGANGDVSKNVYVLSNDNPPKELVILTIKAKVIGEIDIDPSYIRYQSEVGDTENIEISIVSASDKELTLDNVSVALMEYADTTAGNAYHVESVRASPVTDFKLEIPKKVLQPGEKTVLTLAVPSKEKGQINGSIRIVLPNSVVTVGVAGVIVRKQS